MTPQSGNQVLTSLGNSGLCWTVFALNRDTAVPAEGNGDLQTLICVLVARPRRCLTLSNPVPWQNWMAACLGYTLRMGTLFRGWPIMVNDTHTRRRSKSFTSPKVCCSTTVLILFQHDNYTLSLWCSWTIHTKLVIHHGLNCKLSFMWHHIMFTLFSFCMCYGKTAFYCLDELLNSICCTYCWAKSAEEHLICGFTYLFLHCSLYLVVVVSVLCVLWDGTCCWYHTSTWITRVFSLLFHAGQAAIKLPSAEASKQAQCTSPGQYTPCIKGIVKTP